jgi:hypothetical protein
MICHLEAPRPSRQSPGRVALAFRFGLPLFLSIPIDAAFAADPALDPVVITARREPEAIGRSTSDIVVIDAEAIRNTRADSVEDLIRRAAGMQLARNGGPGQSSGYFIRGANTNSTVVLIDGVRVGSATLGQAEFEALRSCAARRRACTAPMPSAASSRSSPVAARARPGGTPRPSSAATTRTAATSARPGRRARGTTRCRSATSRAAASRRSRPATSSASSTPTATASSAIRDRCSSASRRRRATASACAFSRPG